MNLKLREAKTVIAVGVIWLAVGICTFPSAIHGMNWSDGSQIFHFANRLLHGSFPYRDYIYQIGFLPILVDALFQSIFGERFLSTVISLFLFRVGVITFIYLLARENASRTAAVLAALGMTFLWPVLYQGGGHYLVEFLLFASMYLLVSGLKGSSPRLRSGAAGMLLFALIAVRQGDGVMIWAACAAVIAIHAFKNPDTYASPVLLPFLGGSAMSLLLICGTLAFRGALGTAAKQLFIDGPAKKDIHFVRSFADALTGGAIGLREVLRFDLVPAAVCVVAIYILHRRGKDAASFMLASLFLLVVFGFVWQEVRQWRIGNNFDPYAYGNILNYDLPRVLLTLAVPLAILWPRQFEMTFCLPAPLFSLVGAVTLAAVWARQLSWIGRSMTDNPLLAFGIAVCVLMSTCMSNRLRIVLFSALLTVTFGAFCLRAISGRTLTAYEGYYHDNEYMANHPMLANIKISRQKAEALAFLTQNVKKNESCFIVGSSPVLYTLLSCKNPTNVDSTYVDFYTTEDGIRIAAALARSKPKWIIDKPNPPIPFGIDVPVGDV
jgi:hypothetical protein